MSKSAIYTTNTTGATVPVDGIIPVGNTTRRYGCNIKQDGNAITLCGQGYYLVNVSGTLSPSAAGTVSITAQKEGWRCTDSTTNISRDTVPHTWGNTGKHHSKRARSPE